VRARAGAAAPICKRCRRWHGEDRRWWVRRCSASPTGTWPLVQNGWIARGGFTPRRLSGPCGVSCRGGVRRVERRAAERPARFRAPPPDRRRAFRHRCLPRPIAAGTRARPPEDVGGTSGYANFSGSTMKASGSERSPHQISVSRAGSPSGPTSCRGRDRYSGAARIT
jgi:hypothetical protein